MKKKLTIIIIICFICLSVKALANRFDVDTSKLAITKTKTNTITEEFKNDYNLEYKISSKNEKEEKEIEELSKKITYLLLGSGDSKETAEEYYKRRKDYLNYRYNPTIPKDPSSLTGLDQNSQEFIDDAVSGMAVPGVFYLLDERNITYNEIGQIRISMNDNMVISTVTIPNVKTNVVDEDNPMEYKRIKADLFLYYYFKKLNNEYKLYYLFGELDDSLTNNSELEDNETSKSLAISKDHDEQLENIYDFSKVYSLDNNTINNITTNNSSNILIMNSYYNNTLTSSAKGIVISDGIVVTSWTFLEKALRDAQYITIRNNNEIYNLSGIITINPDTDLAVLKLKEQVKTNIKIGNVDKLNIEDPVISISSKSGVGLTAQTGIITSKDGFIQTSISLVESDTGSPLFNSDGELIGMNTSKLINNSLSISINSKALQEIRDKFSNMEKIDIISFDELKEKYFYQSYKKENIVNNIPKSKWNKIKKIGDLEKSIQLKLQKADYDSDVISLRYYNDISKYITSMKIASTYKDNLIKEDYKEILNSDTKCIYTNNKYKIIIMEEFDYLIIVMVKL